MKTGGFPDGRKKDVTEAFFREKELWRYMPYLEVIRDQTRRSIQSLQVVIDGIPRDCWEREYGDMPLWKHVYHTIHSLDKWYRNPFAYSEPPFHVQDLDNLDAVSAAGLSKEQVNVWFSEVKDVILCYLDGLSEEDLQEKPPRCPYTRFHLILAQHRHLDMHIGMLMGFIIAGENRWPRVMGIDDDFEDAGKRLFF